MLTQVAFGMSCVFFEGLILLLLLLLLLLL